MRVLQTPPRYHPFIGGVEEYVATLSEKLVGRGHEVTVLCAQSEPDTPAREVRNSVRVRRLPVFGYLANTPIMPHLPSVLLDEAAQADIIHTHLPTPWSADLSALVGTITRTPTVLTYHNNVVGTGIARVAAGAYNAAPLPTTLRLADTVITTQESYVQRSRPLQSVQSKVECIPNGVDIRRFRPVTVSPGEKRSLGFAPNRTSVLFLSTLDEYHRYKGLDVLLEAMSMLAAIMPEPPQLVVGGDGVLRPEYETLAARLGVESRVRFLGRIPDSELVAAYNAADAFVLPSTDSDQEGFGLVLLEALATGTPVVSTDIVGVADDIESTDVGRVVNRGDPGALAKGIRDVLGWDDGTLPERCRSLCERRYSARTNMERVLDVYSALTRTA
ncbi:glycosyltransferase family 4 protein [Haladaptatus caseinilyticus]|uniref:glycosyltransferase family 4 protein n=1 Tax=Haladaptatus caseinilyticus TaxID=2993314 RepID=UPI00224B28CB|nr:glycosyltransferase family 4 protein [Haladaptatus caseinilyticus]